MGFVISLNLHRRHLNEAQPACVADTLADMPHGGDRRSEQGANWRFVSQEEAAALLNTSVRSIQNAARLEREAPELLPHVMAGRLALDAAIGEVKKQSRLAEIESRCRRGVCHGP